MDRDEKLYFGNSNSFNDLITLFNCNDVQFIFRKHAYNVTFEDGKPCIANIDPDVNDDTELYLKRRKSYDSYESLLLNHKFEDGTAILDALASDEIEEY